jgi:acyl-coenzyme A thioesterase THEM4
MATAIGTKTLRPSLRSLSLPSRLLTMAHSRPSTTTTKRADRAPAYADWLNWMRTNSAPSREIDYFNTIPWAKQLLNNSNFRPIPTPSRTIDPGTTNNAFFAKTLAPSESIPSPIINWLLLVKESLHTPAEAPKGTIGRASGSGDGIVPRSALDSDFVLLLNLGSDLDGFGGVAHGGLLSAVLDEMFSLVVEYHRQSVSEDRAGLFTMKLTTLFRDKVPTPGQVIVKAWLQAREGRKWLLQGQICDEKENVLTEGEGIWMSAKSERL